MWMKSLNGAMKLWKLFVNLKKKIPATFMDIQVHILIHLVDDIETTGVISTRSIFFVERFFKVLKRFVR